MPDIKITIANENDFKNLAPIQVKALEGDHYDCLLYSQDPPNGHQTSIDMKELELWHAARSDSHRIWKATIEENGVEKSVGFSCIRFFTLRYWIEREQIPSYVPAALNYEMLDAKEKALSALLRQHAEQLAEDHYFVWDYLFVLPEYQGMGIDEELIRWGFEHFGLHREIIRVYTAQPKIFLQYGWKEIDVLEFDLGKWGADEMYRVYILVRNSSPLQEPHCSKEV